VNVIVNVATRR